MDQEKIRDRIVELRRIPADQLLSHDRNFRVHPQAQKNAFRGILEEIGVAGALLAYESERNDGQLTLIDGHMRARDFDGDWPVLILDLDDEEADLLLQAYDPVGAMAIADKRILDQLREQAEFRDASVRVMLDSMANVDDGRQDTRAKGGDGSALEAKKSSDERSIPEMELQPYEHYDYVMVIARTSYDWNWLSDRLELEKVNGTNDFRYEKIGLGRVVSAEKLIEKLSAGEAAIERLKELGEYGQND